MQKKTILISHVVGEVNGKEFSCFIRHGARLVEESYCAAFFAVTGETFSEKPREYHASCSNGVVKFLFREPKVRAMLTITAIGRDTE